MATKLERMKSFKKQNNNIFEIDFKPGNHYRPTMPIELKKERNDVLSLMGEKTHSSLAKKLNFIQKSLASCEK